MDIGIAAGRMVLMFRGVDVQADWHRRLRHSSHRDWRVVRCGNCGLVQESVRHSHVTACECRSSEKLATTNSAAILVCRRSIVLAHVSLSLNGTVSH
jgi:hypothetical protein